MSRQHLKEYTEVGKVRKSYGLEGVLRVVLYPATVKAAVEAEYFFVEEYGQKLPLFIQWMEGEGDDFHIKFEDIDDPQTAGQLATAPLFMDKRIVEELLPPDEDTLPFDQKDLIGYRIKDLTSGYLIDIQDISQYPEQLMAHIVINNREEMVPLVDDLIEGIDHQQRLITVRFPEGMFGL
ncbi:MAG: hypothetical protein IT216_01985 [Saprospiraceae bacterium]|nr:MAG: 16S rRNA processing protein rimm [Candidatus Parvibacillus calidus]MCC7147969.1 hypothetical protein [Saprospiraceae bacterium]WKZ63877.1 MAG: hypothetical protein QY315_03590 [Saprospiraceae bacterium]